MPGKILYCRCAFAEVVSQDVKDEVLRGLCASGHSFETVPDLCEMAARKDARLAGIPGEDAMTIIACYPRAVKWLLNSAGVVFPEGEERVRVLNMREETAEMILSQLGEGEKTEEEKE